MANVHGADCSYKGKPRKSGVMLGGGIVEMAKKPVKKVAKKTVKKAY